MADVAGFGSTSYAESAYADETTLDDFQDTGKSAGRFRAQIGWGQPAQRAYSRGEFFEPFIIGKDNLEFATIQITSANGAIVGKVRTDVQKTIIESVDFTLDRRGCADFILRLNALPDFPIEPFSIIQIKIGDTLFDWYKGEMSYVDDEGTEREFFEFRGIGLRNYLRGLKADVDFTAPQDIGLIVDSLVRNFVEPFSPIKYNPAKIETVTGVSIANDIQLGKHFLDKIFDTLTDMSGHQWGVDGDGEMYFEKIDTGDIKKTFFVGYNLESFKPKLNIQAVRNVIMVQRQQGRGSGGQGWSVAGIFNNVESVKRFGRKELNYQIPGFMDDTDAKTIGNAILADISEPKFSALASGLPLVGESDFMDRGQYRVINPFATFKSIFSNVNDSGEWTVTNGTGDDLAVADEDDEFVHETRAIKLTYTSATDATAEIDGDVEAAIQKIRFFVKANRRGAYASVGVGLTNFTENLFKLDIPISGAYFNFDWDVSGLGLTQIKKFGIRIDETSPTGGLFTEILIDKIEFEVKGFKFYKFLLNKAKYKLSPNEQTITLELGNLPPKMETYLAGLFATANELRFTNETR